jgi:hypothetical protein
MVDINTAGNFQLNLGQHVPKCKTGFLLAWAGDKPAE